MADLRPDDFEKLYDRLAAKHGVVTLGREVTMVRSVFKYALESDLIEGGFHSGQSSRRPVRPIDARPARRKRTSTASGRRN